MFTDECLTSLSLSCHTVKAFFHERANAIVCLNSLEMMVREDPADVMYTCVCVDHRPQRRVTHLYFSSLREEMLA